MQFDAPYRFSGGRDAKAAKDLLRILGSVEAVIDRATAAWSHHVGWHCSKAVTFHYLHHHINEIEAELRKVGKTPAKATEAEPPKRSGPILEPLDLTDEEIEQGHRFSKALNARR